MAVGQLGGTALAARLRGLYLGGLPRDANLSAVPHATTLHGFTGTIADFIVDGVSVQNPT